MTAAAPIDVVVRCTFEGCEPALTMRVLMATIDNLVAHADPSVDVLDSIEFPIGESVIALHPFGVASAGVEVRDDRLDVAFELRSPLRSSTESVLGDSSDVVHAFFEVERQDDPPRIRLIGRLS